MQKSRDIYLQISLVAFAFINTNCGAVNNLENNHITMAGVFFGMRKRGGITGIRKLTIDSMGISWDEITEKRQQLLESLKDDVEKIFDDLCTERDFRCVLIIIHIIYIYIAS